MAFMDYWAQERRLLKQREQMVKVLSKLYLQFVNEEIDEVIGGNGVCAEGSYDDAM